MARQRTAKSAVSTRRAAKVDAVCQPKPAVTAAETAQNAVALPDWKFEVQHDDIARRAYELWLAEGRPAGRETQHWLEAENQLRARSGATAFRGS